MNNQYSIGSEWRKWDLHIHTPNTKLNNQYNPDGSDVWDTFCEKLEKSDVMAFGITDYFSVDNYYSFIEKFKKKYPDSKKIFFPNIEIRISEVVNPAQEEINLHLIFNPFETEMEVSIKKFLQKLKTNKTLASGRNTTVDELKSGKEFEEATTSRIFISNALEDVFGKTKKLTDHVLILTAANNDGIRPETEECQGKRRGKKRKALISDEVDKFSNAFFGNTNNAKYFLDPRRLEDKLDVIDSKPVVTGCDAHSFDELDKWLGKVVIDGSIKKQPTWIKADLTYEGLKQILFEPELRVYIGEEPEVESRVRSNSTKYIESLKIDQIEGYDERSGRWFQNEHIKFNKELVAIIGNKGSGKSAITDIIGLLANSHNQITKDRYGKEEELFSFLTEDKFHKNKISSKFQGSLIWYSGEKDSNILNSYTDIYIPEKVEYLPQKYLEKICSDIEDDEFREKLNEVIFGYVENKDRYGNVNLKELISYRTKQVEEDINSLKSTLQKYNEAIVSLEMKLTNNYKKEIEESLKRKQEEKDAHFKNKPLQIDPPGEISLENENSTKIIELEERAQIIKEEIVKIKLEQSDFYKQVEDLKQAKRAFERFFDELNTLKITYKNLLDTVKINIEDIIQLSFNNNVLDNLITEKEKYINEIDIKLRSKDEINELEKDDLLREKTYEKSLVIKYENIISEKQSIIDILDKPQREYQIYLKQIESWNVKSFEIEGTEKNPEENTLNWYKQEADRITNIYSKELEKKRLERVGCSLKIFNKKKEIITFYNSIKKSIDGEILKNGTELSDYSISIQANFRLENSFYDNFFNYIGQNVKGSFQYVDKGRSTLKEIMRTVSNWENEDHVVLMLKSIIEHLDKNINSDTAESRDIFTQMKQGKDPTEFYDYLFGLDYIQTKYDLKVDNKDLSELSPGERGGLLLVFYLMLDKRDVPLIIDQPEDNLDNKSIYEILVTFLKKAKKRRQVIMVTHNPNLAVVADAEQIIYVSIDKKNKNDFSFFSGSIENSDINTKLVDILEGTLPAFNNRKLKYREFI